MIEDGLTLQGCRIVGGWQMGGQDFFGCANGTGKIIRCAEGPRKKLMITQQKKMVPPYSLKMIAPQKGKNDFQFPHWGSIS